MRVISWAAALLCALVATPAAALTGLTYAGNGTTLFDAPMPDVGVMYGVAANGDLLWYRYGGNGEQDRSGGTGWHPNSGNPIGNGWGNFKLLLGAGNGVILAVEPNGDLRWYQYTGEGTADRSGNSGWHPNSGNVIGNGWGNFRQLVVSPRQGPLTSRGVTLYGVTQKGDLLWYRYDGDGTEDRSGNTGWAPNSGNPIGNGWQGFKRLVGVGDLLLGIQPNGDLLWYKYTGDGTRDRSGGTGWHPNSGNPIGNGWQNFRTVFGGTRGGGSVLYAVKGNGDLLWYRYDGKGGSDRSGSTGWAPNSGHTIGNGW